MILDTHLITHHYSLRLARPARTLLPYYSEYIYTYIQAAQVVKLKLPGSQCFSLFNTLASFLVAQSAIAMFVIIGLTPLALGNTDASTT